jgi:hypothetical protein
MDFNPDTINKLIGAKVATYKSITDQPCTKKGEKEKMADFKLKQDIHSNTKPYEGHTGNQPKDSNREQRMEDAFSFLTDELDDIYDDMGLGDFDIYGESDEEEGGEDDTPEDPMSRIKEGLGRLTQGSPKKKFYHSAKRHKRNTRKHYDGIRRDVVGNAAKVVGATKGMNPEEAKGIALLADSVIAPAARGTASMARKAAGRILKRR